MKVTVRPRWWEGASVSTLVVGVAENGMVSHDGRWVGLVKKSERTWERRTRGARFVNARGTAVEWHGWLPESGSARPDVRGDTRGEVIRKLVEAPCGR